MKRKHWLRLGAFLLTCFLVLSFLTGFLCVPDSRNVIRVYGFYLEPKDSIDVAFIGNSHVYTGFYSPLAYEKYGFTSYALSISGMKVSCFKSAIEEMRSRQDPQLYVVEVDGFIEENQFSSAVRWWTDSIPNSKNRTATIRELVKDPAEWNDHFFRYRKYHVNWTNFSDCLRAFEDKRAMNARGYSITKAFDTKTNKVGLDKKVYPYAVNNDAFACLKDLIAYLQENEIENVLFLRMATAMIYDEQDSFRAALDYIQEAGYPYLDLNAWREEIGLDPTNDYYNSGHHNIYGAEKVTNYLSQYIVDHYDLTLDHTDAVNAQWDICASYNDQILTTFKSRTDQNEGTYYYGEEIAAAR